MNRTRDNQISSSREELDNQIRSYREAVDDLVVLLTNDDGPPPDDLGRMRRQMSIVLLRAEAAVDAGRSHLIYRNKA